MIKKTVGFIIFASKRLGAELVAPSHKSLDKAIFLAILPNRQGDGG